MARLVYFAPRGGLPLVEDLERAGYIVFEALAISEVLHLIETENIDAVIVAPDITRDRTSAIETRATTLRLTDITTPADVIWEISNIFLGSRTTH